MKISDVLLIKKYSRQYNLQFGLVIVLSLICALFEIINIGALVPLLQLLENPEPPGGTLWDLLQNFYNLIGIQLTFTSLLCLLLILFLLGQFLFFLKKKLQLFIQNNITRDVKNIVFKTAMDADIISHQQKNSSQFINALLSESSYTGAGVFSLCELIADVFFIFTYAFLLLYLSVEMTVICVIIASLSMLSMNILLKQSAEYGKKNVENSIIQNDFINERFNLLRLIKASSTEKMECQKMETIAEKIRYDNIQYTITGVKIEIIFQVIIFILAVGILFISVTFLDIPLASLLVFLFILIRITTPLRDFNNRRHEFARYIESYYNIDEILSDVDSLKKITSGNIPFRGLDKCLQISHINFSYNHDTPILKDISIAISKNEFIAFVGASGGGKSTLANIFARLIDPDSGEVTIDGINLKNYDLPSFHSKIGLVSQEIFIFNDSALNNICYGSDRCSVADAIESAKIAHAHDFINALPNGYNTILGESGVKLSGGQKQRIALARAIYKNPEILILDEATSSLDTESEKIIQDAINNIKKKYTIIAIAHRLSTIENADRIYVVEKGEIIESGTHTELLQQEGLYTKYYELQHSKKGVPDNCPDSDSPTLLKDFN